MKIKKTFTRSRMLRGIVFTLSVCLALTAISAGVASYTPAAKAVNAGDWNTVVSNLQAGNYVTLTANITANSTANIPSGKSPTLNLGGYTISRSGGDARIGGSGDHWSIRYTTVEAWIDQTRLSPEVISVAAGGTLTITGTGNINSSSAASTSGSNRQDWYCSARCINNAGTLNISINGQIYAYAAERADGGHAHCAGSVAVPIYNTGTVNMYSGSITCNANGMGRTYGSIWSGRRGGAFTDSIGVAIYSKSGTVNMYGGALRGEAHCDDQADTGDSYDGNYSSMLAYGVGLDLTNSSNVNVYGGSISGGSHMYNDPGDIDGHHFSVAVGVNYAGSNTPRVYGGYIGSFYPTNSVLCSSTGNGTVHAMRAAISRITALTLSPNGGNSGSISVNTSAQYYNEYNKLYTTSYSAPAAVQTATTGVELQSGAANGRKVRVYYRFYNAGTTVGSTPAYTTQYHLDSYCTTRIGAASTFSGVSNSGTTGTSTGGGERLYTGTISSGTSNFKNTYFYNSSKTTYTYITQANTAAFPSLTAAGTTLGSLTPAANSLTIIFVNLIMEPTATSTVLMYDADIQYNGVALRPNTDFTIRINGTVGTTTTDCSSRYDLTTTGSGTDVTYAYSTNGGTSFTNGLPTAVGSYVLRCTVPDTSTPSATGANMTAASATCNINITKCSPVLSASNPTITYGTQTGSIPTSSFSVNSNNVLNANLTAQGRWIWQNPDDYLTVPQSGAQRTITWEPNPTYAASYNTVSVTLTVTVNKRPLTTAAIATSALNLPSNGVPSGVVTYGDTVTFSESFFNWGNIAPCDDAAEVFSELASTVQVGGATYAAGKAAGSYTYGITGTSITNYTVTNSAASFVVAKRQLSVVAQAQDREYDGTVNVEVSFPAGSASNNFSGDVVGTAAGVTINSVTGTVASADVGQNKAVTVPTPTLGGSKAGNYTVLVTNSGSCTVNITQKAPTAAVPTLTGITYDSTKTLADFYNNGSGNIASSASGETAGVWKWTTDSGTTVPTVTNSGYSATFYPTSGNYSTKTETVAVTVAKREITVSASAPAISYGAAIPTYTFSFSGFTETNSANPGAEFFAVTGGTTITAVGFTVGGQMPALSCSYAAGSNAGSYPITITQSLTADNYTFVTDATAALIVNKVVLTVTAQNKTITYGDAIPTYTSTISGFVLEENAGVVTGWSTTLACNCAYVPGADSTTTGYAIVPNVAALSATNYTFNAVNGKLFVNKAVLTVTPDNKTLNYNSPVPALTYTYAGLTGGDEASVVNGTPTLSTTYTQGSSCDEIYLITVTSTAALSATNYTFTTAEGHIYVVKAPVAITTWPTSRVITYEDSLAQAVISADGVALSGSTPVAGTWKYVYDAVTPAYTDSEVTLYDFQFVPTNVNYETVATTLTVTVNKRPVSGTPSIQGSLMATATVFASLDSMNPSAIGRYNFEWTIEGVTVSTTNYYQIVNADQGKYLTLTVTAKSSVPYTGSASTTSEMTISPPLPEPDASLLNTAIPSGIVYDTLAHTATITAKPSVTGLGNITVRYNNSTEAPVSAGEYRVTVDISAGSAYAPVSGMFIANITINKAPIVVTFSVLNKVYDARTSATLNSDIPVSYHGAYAGDDVSVNAEAASYSFETPDVGNNKAVYMENAILEGTDNVDYYIITDSSVTASITPKTITALARPISRTYSPDSNTVEVDFSSISGILSSDRSYVSLADGVGTLSSNDAGTRTITDIAYSLTGAKAGNYALNITNAEGLTVTIAKASPLTIASFAVPTTSPMTYDGRVLDTVPLPSGWSWNDGDTVIPVCANTGYPATYTPANTDNYYTVTYTLPLTVSKANLTVTFNDLAVTYGQTLPTVTYNITGFVAEETIASFGGNITYQSTYMQFSPADGNYEINAAASSSLFNANYNITYVPGRVTVAKKDIYATPAAVSRSYIAGNTEVAVSFTLDNSMKARSNDDVYLSFAYSTGTIADENAGTKAVTYTAPVLSGTSAGSYVLTVINPELTVTISKVLPSSYTFPAAATISYGQPLSQAQFTTAGLGDGTFTFAQPEEIPTSIGFFPSTYEVIFTPSNTNYQTVSRRIPLTVSIAAITPTVTITGSMYVGNTLSATVSGADANAKNFIHYEWYRVNTADGTKTEIGEDMENYVITEADVGYSVEVSVSFDSPYSGTASFSATKIIEQENLTFIQKLWKWWYSILDAIRSLFRK